MTPRTFRGLFLATVLLVASTPACSTMMKVPVHSEPTGARILLDGEDTGLRTPTELAFTTSQKEYLVTLQRQGYNDITQKVVLQTDVDVMTPKEIATTIICSPCCLFLPLLNLLQPVEVDKRFVPSEIHASMDPLGQGLKVSGLPAPADTEVFVDGELDALLEGQYLMMEPGRHEVEFLAPGYRPLRFTAQVAEAIYEHRELALLVEGQGLMLSSSPAGARLLVDGQYQGQLDVEPRRVRLDPGPHQVAVELDGYQSREEVVQIVVDEYRTLHLLLEPAGQGVIVRRSADLPRRTEEVQILVDGDLLGTSFDQPYQLEPGRYSIEVRVPGFAPWSQSVRITASKFLELTPELRRDV